MKWNSYFLLVTLGACGKMTSLPENAQPATIPPPHQTMSPADASPVAFDSASPVASGPRSFAVRTVPLPGASGPVTLDYIVADRARGRIWIPVADTGSVDVFDIATSAFTRIDGFRTNKAEVRGMTRAMGPSAAAIGDGYVYVGNRATSEVCAIDERTLRLGMCLKLPIPSDGLEYVASKKEVWATTPRDHSLTVLDATQPDSIKPKLVIKTVGNPEGYAIDEARGLFYTNLEDTDRTIVVDVRTHAVVATWNPECGSEGPRGIAVDADRRLILVACTASLHVLDGAHDGVRLGALDTGPGVDNIDILNTKKLVYVAASKAARVSVARVDDGGQPSIVATGTTAQGARNAVADANGNIYVVDAKLSQLLILSPTTAPSP